MTSRQLTALGRRIMRRLDMHEWIAGAVFRVRKLDGLDGESCWHPEERKCWIAVSPGPEMEETLVHECLHVLIEGHKPIVPDYDPGYELALNRMAKALWSEWKE